jgi:hypothetical protein
MPLSPKDAAWRSAHLDKMMVSIADVPWQRSENRQVGMAIADGCETDAASARPGASHGLQGYRCCN